jgi:hypothetical protein
MLAQVLLVDLFNPSSTHPSVNRTVQFAITLTAAPLATVFRIQSVDFFATQKVRILPQPLLVSDQILNIIFVVFRITLTSIMIQTPGKRAKQSSVDRKALRQKRDQRRL